MMAHTIEESLHPKNFEDHTRGVPQDPQSDYNAGQKAWDSHQVSKRGPFDHASDTPIELRKMSNVPLDRGAMG